MKHSLRLVLATLLLLSPALPAPAETTGDLSASAKSDSPLMVIRFNRSNVDYAMPLYNTLNRALKVKPSAMFDVVSVAPHAQVEHNQPSYNQMAADNTNKVLGTMKEIGLPARRITLSNIVDNVDSTEVRIYVH